MKRISASSTAESIRRCEKVAPATVNRELALFDKDGTVIDQTTAQDFFAAVANVNGFNPTFDPWSIFDPYSQRYFVLYEEVERLRRQQEENGELERRRRERRREEFLELIQRRIRSRFLHFADKDGHLKKLTERVAAGELDAYSACAQVLEDTEWLGKWLLENR